jgi:cytochrome c oxidase subunit I+III
LITTAVDARPVQCLRLGGPTFLTFFAALFTGGVFIFSTFHWWWAALVSGVFAFVTIVIWLWTGTALIPEKPQKHVGMGLTLPLYASGSDSVGWWAMLITMLGDMTAFVSLVFGYFFYWTSRPDFTADTAGPGATWPVIALALAGAAWTLTTVARRLNARDHAPAFGAAISLGALMAVGSAAALIAAPLATGLDPERHVYDATVWVLVIWTAIHLSAGAVMQLYALARRLAGRMTARHDIDIANVTLYWHFAALTALITVAVIAGFPIVD